MGGSGAACSAPPATILAEIPHKGKSDAWQEGSQEDSGKSEQIKNEQTRRRTAYHLAGHVVLAHRVELHIGDITILPDGSISCDLSDTSGSACEWDVCMMLLAGPVTERLVVERDDLGLILGNFEDCQSAKFEVERVFADYRDPDERQRLVHEFVQDARETVMALLAHPTLGGAVARLADELLKHGTLSGAAVKAIIDESLGRAKRTDTRGDH